MVAMYFFWGGHKAENTTDNQTSVQSPVSNTRATEHAEVSESIKPSPIREHLEEKHRDDFSGKTAALNSKKNVNLTPEYICKDESNFISKNNCLWRECENPKFSDLPECELRTNDKSQYNKEQIGIEVKPLADK
jgi:hypothetical protein